MPPTLAGNLNPVFAGYFDAAIGEPPGAIQFLSEVSEEPDTADGMRICRLVRDGAAPVDSPTRRCAIPIRSGHRRDRPTANRC